MHSIVRYKDVSKLFLPCSFYQTCLKAGSIAFYHIIPAMLNKSLLFGGLIGVVVAGVLPNNGVGLGKRDTDTADHPSTCTNGPYSRDCWSNGFSINTDTEEKWPNTGKVVKYSLSITNQTMAPDGTPRQMLVINGQFPGPVLTAGKL